MLPSQMQTILKLFLAKLVIDLTYGKANRDGERSLQFTGGSVGGLVEEYASRRYARTCKHQSRGSCILLSTTATSVLLDDLKPLEHFKVIEECR